MVVRAYHKGFPPDVVGTSVSDLHGRLSLAKGDFTTPVLLLDQRALTYNVITMQDFCTAHALSLSPHVKTTMSPEIIEQQLSHGAWAVTVATHTQARTLRTELGLDRILMANEVVDPLAIEWLGRELDADENFTAYCYVDSCVGLASMEKVLSERGQRRPLPVLIEYGMASGRAGVRTADEALQLARAVSSAKNVRLAGVSGFEGIINTHLRADELETVAEYLRELRAVADLIYPLAAAPDVEFLVSAGGSCFFDLLPTVFDIQWRADRPIRTVLRSGCYVTHDSVALEQHRRLIAQRCDAVPLSPALELWAHVISRPEPDLAILDFGRRDVGTDAGLPRPQHLLRQNDRPIEAYQGAEVFALNDQHAYLRLGSDQTADDPAVGDLIGLGVSHPCTTIDKWRLVPVVDTDRTLTGAVRTWF